MRITTLAEQETVIQWDREERVVHIWTADPVSYRKLAKLGLKPVEETYAKDNGELTGRFYEMRLADFRWGVKKPRTAAQLAAARKAGAQLQNAKKLLRFGEVDEAGQGVG